MPTTSADPAGPKSKLSLDALIDAAITMIEAEGLEQLSMRKLGDHFGIKAASVYWYLASKEQLLDLVYDRLMQEVAELILNANVAISPIEDRIMDVARTYRSFLLTHADAAKVLTSRVAVGPGLVGVLESMMSMFERAGLTGRAALDASWAVLGFVESSVIRDQAPISAVDAGPNRERLISLQEMAERLHAFQETEYPRLRSVITELTSHNQTPRFQSGIASLLRGLLTPSTTA